MQVASGLSVLFALAVIAFSGYKIGNNQAKIDMLEQTSKCADEVLKVSVNSFYQHNDSTITRTYYAHAEAFHEMKWAKCFRQEIYK